MITLRQHRCATIDLSKVKTHKVINMKHSVISIDLAKNVFQICALDKDNNIVMNRQVSRRKLMQVMSQFEPTLVVMEACYSSNHWGRQFQTLGHHVKLIPAYRVKPFVVGNKNDANDALAIAESSKRPKMNFVPVKPLEQQDIQTIFRIRERLIKARTALVNQLRGLLSEYGFAVDKTSTKLRNALPEILEDADNALTVSARKMFHLLSAQWQYFNEQIDNITNELCSLSKAQPDYELLNSIPGVGPIVSSVFIASVGDVAHFKNGRQLAAWLGLTPKQYSSGETNFMGKMSKRGNVNLRKMLIHGARTVINWCKGKDDQLSRWLQRLLEHKHACKVVVALANKMARMAWAILTHRKPFDIKLTAI